MKTCLMCDTEIKETRTVCSERCRSKYYRENLRFESQTPEVRFNNRFLLMKRAKV